MCCVVSAFNELLCCVVLCAKLNPKIYVHFKRPQLETGPSMTNDWHAKITKGPLPIKPLLLLVWWCLMLCAVQRSIFEHFVFSACHPLKGQLDTIQQAPLPRPSQSPSQDGYTGLLHPQAELWQHMLHSSGIMAHARNGPGRQPRTHTGMEKHYRR